MEQVPGVGHVTDESKLKGNSTPEARTAQHPAAPRQLPGQNDLWPWLQSAIAENQGAAQPSNPAAYPAAAPRPCRAWRPPACRR